jgi:hypothetical protein
MMEISEQSFGFDSLTTTPESTAAEINDMKAIMLAIALKLEPHARKQLIIELSEVDSTPVQQWVTNLKRISRD